MSCVLERALGRLIKRGNLKFKLDKMSLEIIYTAVIRLILEYGDVSWVNFAQYVKKESEKTSRTSKNSHLYIYIY